MMKWIASLLGLLALVLLGATYYPSDDLVIFRGGIRGPVWDAGGLVFDIRIFGAKPNDGLDDTEAIKKAVVAATPTCGTVRFPVGTFKVGGGTGDCFVTLEPCVVYEGSGTGLDDGGGTVIDGTAGCDSFRLREKLSGGSYDIGPYVIRNMTFLHGQNQLVARDHNTFVQLENIFFNTPTNAGLLMQGCHEEWFLQNITWQAGVHAWQYEHVLIDNSTCSWNYIDKTICQNCYAGGTSGGGFYWEIDYGGSLLFPNLILVNNTGNSFYLDGALNSVQIFNINTEGGNYGGKTNDTTGDVDLGDPDCIDGIASMTGFATGDVVTLRGAGNQGKDFTATVTDTACNGASSLLVDDDAETAVTGEILTNRKYDDIQVVNTLGRCTGGAYRTSCTEDSDCTPNTCDKQGGSSNWTIVGGNIGSTKTRYSVNGLNNVTFIGTTASRVAYDSAQTMSSVGGTMSLRTPTGNQIDQFNRTVLSGATGVTDETEFSLIHSPPGKDIRLVLRDADLSSTGEDYELVAVYRYDQNKTKIWHVDGGESIAGDTLFGDCYTRAAFSSGGATLANIDKNPGAGTMIYCSDCTPASDPCSGSGSGTWAFRINTSSPYWKCL